MTIVMDQDIVSIASAL